MRSVLTIREKRVAQKSNLFKLIHKFHIYAGIFVAIHFAILSLTGVILLFKDDIQGNHKSSRQEVIANKEKFAEKYNQALINLQKLYPKDRPLDIYPDESNTQIIEARLGMNGSTKVHGARIVDLDFNSGKIFTQNALPAASFYNWVFTLHHELFMGTCGQLYIGFVGMMYVLMLLSGLFLYVKFMKGRRFGQLRLARLPKLADLHKYFGIVILAWGLLVGISGMLLAFNPIFTKHFQNNNLRHLTQQYQNVPETDEKAAPLRDIINTASQSKPNFLIWYIVFPGMERGIPGHYLVLMHGTTPLTWQVSEYLVINAKTAKLVEIVQLPILMQSALVATPLHFANYGGIFLKVIWSLFALGSLAVVTFGVLVFFLKWRRRYA